MRFAQIGNARVEGGLYQAVVVAGGYRLRCGLARISFYNVNFTRCRNNVKYLSMKLDAIIRGMKTIRTEALLGKGICNKCGHK